LLYQRSVDPGQHQRPTNIIAIPHYLLAVAGAIVVSEVTQHVVQRFDQELNRLCDLVAKMATNVESQVALASKAVLELDAKAATQAIEADPEVDALEREIEQFVIRLLALRQPFAGDLRTIIAALKASDDLERIGDYAANVAKRSIVLAQAPPSFGLASLAHMADLVQQNLHRMVTILVHPDAGTAAEVWSADKAVDDVYNAVFRELITYMLENPPNITPCTHLLFVARNLERIGDHTTNVAETVYYATTGEELSGPRPKTESDMYLP
jgi:phosphate transport system protein